MSLYGLRCLVHTFCETLHSRNQSKKHRKDATKADQICGWEVVCVCVLWGGGLFISKSSFFFTPSPFFPGAKLSHAHTHALSVTTTLFTGGPSFSHPLGGLEGAGGGVQVLAEGDTSLLGEPTRAAGYSL